MRPFHFVIDRGQCDTRDRRRDEKSDTESDEAQDIDEHSHKEKRKYFPLFAFGHHEASLDRLPEREVFEAWRPCLQDDERHEDSHDGDYDARDNEEKESNDDKDTRDDRRQEIVDSLVGCEEGKEIFPGNFLTETYAEEDLSQDETCEKTDQKPEHGRSGQDIYEINEDFQTDQKPEIFFGLLPTKP